MTACAYCGTDRPGWQLMIVVNSATGVTEPICAEPWAFECADAVPPVAAPVADGDAKARAKALVSDLLDVRHGEPS